VNPGVEVNLAVGGKLMCDVSREIDDVLIEVLEQRYKPKNPAAVRKLAEVFTKPEAAYFSHWDEAAIAKHDAMPAPGELHLGPASGDSPGAATYVNEPFLNEEGRKAYRAALLVAYDMLQSCANDFDDAGRIGRIGKCLMDAVADIETLELGKG